MRKSITLRAFPSEMDTLSRIRLARDAGYDGVEINLEPDEEFTLESSEEELRQLRHAVAAAGMTFSSIYCRQQWQYPISSQNPECRSRGREIIVSLVKAASILNAEAVLVVPGAVDNSLFSSEPEIVRYDDAYTTVQAVLRDLGHTTLDAYQDVYLALENVWNKFLLSPLEFARFVDEINHPRIGIYFDVGNVMRTGFPEHWIRILGQRIKRVHFKDFRLSVDNVGGFVSLLEGDVNWPAVCESLRAIGYDSWITVEVVPQYRYYGEQLIYETGRKLDAILQSQSSAFPSN